MKISIPLSLLYVGVGISVATSIGIAQAGTRSSKASSLPASSSYSSSPSSSTARSSSHSSSSTRQTVIHQYVRHSSSGGSDDARKPSEVADEDAAFKNVRDSLNVSPEAMNKLESTMEHLAKISEDHSEMATRANTDGFRYCAMWVKNDLVKAGLVSEALREANNAPAIETPSFLEKDAGFVALPKGTNGLPEGWKSLYDAAPGTILVYRNFYPPFAGHIEVRTHDGFSSDFFKASPITGVRGSVEGHQHSFYNAYVPGPSTN